MSAASKLEASATVMIGTHELVRAEVEMAKAKLSHVLIKMGKRHTHFLGEAAE